MSGAYRPTSPQDLVAALSDLITARPVAGSAIRVLLDGPHNASTLALADDLAENVQTRGRPAVVLRADTFWRDASLRLEFGRQDTLALPTWLDRGAVNREVLDPLGAGGSGQYLPSLRDPHTNRATRAQPQLAPPGTVLILAGALLLGQDLHSDLVIHLAVSPGARARALADELAWTLPAFDTYDEQVRPAELADVSIRYDDPQHPAVRW